MLQLLILAIWICTISANPTTIFKQRISQGNFIDIEDAPYQVVIMDTRYESSICGASIIAPEYILTAAHCVEALPENYLVRSGTKYYKRGGTEHRVIEITPHDYQFTGIPKNDIAIVKVAPPFKLDGKTERIIELFEKDEEAEAGTPSLVSGWGLTEHNKPSQQLKSLAVEIISKDVCSKTFESLGGIDDKQICAAHSTGAGNACTGDSGGPLIIDGRLVGVVSWGHAVCKLDYFPSVYTEVAAYRDWIDQHIQLAA